MGHEAGALVPVDEKTVDFYGDELQGVIVTITPSEQVILVPVRPMCDYLGVAWSAQRLRINRDPVLSDVVRTVEQAEEVKAKVQAVAMQLTEYDPGKNHFQGIFTELHRRFGVSSYKNIRQDRYHEVMAWLDEWGRRAGAGKGEANE